MDPTYNEDNDVQLAEKEETEKTEVCLNSENEQEEHGPEETFKSQAAIELHSKVTAFCDEINQNNGEFANTALSLREESMSRIGAFLENAEFALQSLHEDKQKSYHRILSEIQDGLKRIDVVQQEIEDFRGMVLEFYNVLMGITPRASAA
eukprot:Colp12_sorted_trinity150504_noHs@29724